MGRRVELGSGGHERGSESDKITFYKNFEELTKKNKNTLYIGKHKEVEPGCRSEKRETVEDRERRLRPPTPQLGLHNWVTVGSAL